MSISFDGALEIIDLDVEDLIGLSEAEIQTELTEKMPEVSASDLTTFMEDLRARLDEIEVELQELEDGYEEDLDNSETVDGQTRYELKLEEVAEALDAIDLIDDAAQEVIDHELLLNIEKSDDIYWEYDTNDLNGLNDGDVVNMTALAGAQTGLGLTEDEEDAPEPVDANGDGIITYDETLPSVESITDESFTAQEIYLTVNAGDTLSLISHSGTATTFQIVTLDGKTITLNVKGDSNIYFAGTDYLDTALLDSWPEDLLKRCHDNDEPLSLYDSLHEDEVTMEERLSVIAGYDDIVSQDNFNAIQATYGLTASYDAYAAAMENLFTWIDDPSEDKGFLEEVWNGIYLDNGGTLPADLITAMVLGVARHGDQTLFSALFAPAIGRLETSLGYDQATAKETDAMTANAKMTAMLLELHSGAAGPLGGADLFWDSTFAIEDPTLAGAYVPGQWINHATNAQAIELYREEIYNVGWILESGSESAAQMREEAAQHVEENPEELPEEITVNLQDELQGLAGSGTKYAYGGNMSDEEWDEAVEKLINKLFDGNGDLVNPLTAFKEVMDEMCERKENGEYKKDWADNLASSLLHAIHTECPGLAAKIFGSSEDQDPYGIVNFLWKITKYDDDNETSGGIHGDKPHYYDEAYTAYAAYT